MINAKEELLKIIEESKTEIICAIISYEAIFYRGREFTRGAFVLKKDHSKEDLEKFLDKLDFIYDNSYGGQELHGTVWLKDGTWLSRREYDGSEWWIHDKLPEIPEECL